MGLPAIIPFVPSAHGLSWMEQLILQISREPLGILGPVLFLLLLLTLALWKRAPWYAMAIPIVLLILLLLILFGPSLPKGGAL